jgi:hypothetical protein
MTNSKLFALLKNLNEFQTGLLFSAIGGLPILPFYTLAPLFGMFVINKRDVEMSTQEKTKVILVFLTWILATNHNISMFSLLLGSLLLNYTKEELPKIPTYQDLITSFDNLIKEIPIIKSDMKFKYENLKEKTLLVKENVLSKIKNISFSKLEAETSDTEILETEVDKQINEIEVPESHTPNQEAVVPEIVPPNLEVRSTVLSEDIEPIKNVTDDFSDSSSLIQEGDFPKTSSKKTKK